MKRSLNLLPLGHRVRELTLRRLLAWSLVWAACVAMTLGLWWLKHSRCRAARQSLEAAQSSYEPLERLLAQSESMQEELDWLHASGIVSGKLLDDRPVLTLIGQVGESASECHGRLVVRNLVFERREQPVEIDRPDARGPDEKTPEPEPKDTGPWAVVTLEGEAVDNLAVATFVVGLRDSGLFRRVELKSSHEKSPTVNAFRSYQIECDI